MGVLNGLWNSLLELGNTYRALELLTGTHFNTFGFPLSGPSVLLWGKALVGREQKSDGQLLVVIILKTLDYFRLNAG